MFRTVAANSRLTALSGAALLVLLAAEGVTIPRIRFLLTPHLFLGIVLIPPVALKVISTGYRFCRYYSRDRSYRAAGPPPLLHRLAGPPLVLSTVGVLATGVAAWLGGPYSSTPWLRFHTISFLAWFVLMTLHVLGRVGRSGDESLRDLADAQRGEPGARARGWLVGGSILAGVVAAALAIQLPTGWANAFGP